MRNEGFWNRRFTRTRIKSEKVQRSEILFGYILGPVGVTIAGSVSGSILQNYFTDVLRLDLHFLAKLQLVTTVLVVVMNLVAGQLIEHTHASAGKARPWLLVSAFTLSLTYLMMFVTPFRGAAQMIWIAIAYNLYLSFAAPVYSTANNVLVTLSTRDVGQRGTITSISSMMGLGTVGVCGVVLPLLVSYVLKDDLKRWLVAMLGISIYLCGFIYLQFIYTRERVTEERRIMAGLLGDDDEREKQLVVPQAAESVPFYKQLKAVLTDRMWWVIMLFHLLFQWSGALKNGSMTYYCKWVMDNSFSGNAGAWGASQAALSIAGALPMAIASVIIFPLSKKYSKRVLCGVFLLIGAVGGVIAGMAQGRFIPVAIGVALKCFGSLPTCCLIVAMVADVIDHIEYKTGIRTDSLTMSVYSSLTAAGSSVMNALFNLALAHFGYDQHADVALGAAAQSAAIRSVISGGYIWAETIGYFVAGLLLLLFWKVEEKLAAERKAYTGE